VTRYGLWNMTTDFGVGEIHLNSLELGRLYYIFICHSWRLSRPELIEIKPALVVFSDSVFVVQLMGLRRIELAA